MSFIKSKILELGGSITHEYSTVLTGFAFKFPGSVAGRALKTLKDLNGAEWPFFIEEDTVVSINGEEPN